MIEIHALIHTPFEKPGYIEQWANAKGYNISLTKLYEPFILPDPIDIDWLIVMGGPMGVYDEEKFPWLKDEKAFIRKAINLNKIVLGICLGSQLIAEILGAKVFRNNFKEIGWFKIKTTIKAEQEDLFNLFPKEAIVFHWHGDTYNLPPHAIHLAESDVCKNQAYIFNERVIGLQFHIEVTPDLLNEMLAGGSDELKKNKYIQTEEEIRNGIKFCKEANILLHRLLDKLEKKFAVK
jgi:GMP synthase-like glutamine amidotransferase